MSFLATTPDLSAGDQSPMPYEISGPVPVVHGRARIPLRLIESPFNHRTFDHGSRRPTGNIYSLALAGCWGPVTRVFEIYNNGRPLGISETAHGDYTDTAHDSWAGPANDPTFAQVRIYWGTPTQQPDPFLNGTARHGIQGARNHDGSARVHPAYTGIFYVIFHRLHLDDGYGSSLSGTANIPPIEADVFVDAGFGGSHHEHGVNPIAAAHQLLTNPIWGASLPDALVSPASWQSAAAALEGEHPVYSAWSTPLISPVLSETRDLAAALGSLLGYFDGYLQVKDNGVVPGWFRRDPSQWPSATVISRHDLLEDPDIEPGSWEDTVNEVSVESLNVYQRMEEVTVTERNTYVRQVRDTDARETINGKYIINPAQQRAYALRELNDRSQPPMKAKLVIPRSKRHGDGSLILPGDLIHLDYEPYSIDLPCRVIEREDRGSSVSLRVERDKDAFPEEYEPPEDTRLLPLIDPPELITKAVIFQTPYDFPGGPDITACVFAVRPHGGIAGAQLWASATGAFTGEEGPLEALTAFADEVTINTADASTVSFTHVNPLDVSLNRSFGAAEQVDGAMLILVNGELISLGARDGTYGAPPLHKYSCTRGMWGAASTVNPDGATGYVFPRQVFEQAMRRHESMFAEETWHVAMRTYTALETDDETANFSAPIQIYAPRDPWDFVQQHGAFSTENRGYLHYGGGQVEIGNNGDLENPLTVDTIVPQIDYRHGMTEFANETWPCFAIRKVGAEGTRSQWAFLPFKSYGAPSSFPSYFQGRQRVIVGVSDVSGARWQNLDGGNFVNPFPASQAVLHSCHAVRLTGTGGYEVGTSDWANGGVPSFMFSGSGDGFATVPANGWTATDHLWVKVPAGTTYRFSFFFRHIPD